MAPHGWDWFAAFTAASEGHETPDDEGIDLADQFARCFSSDDGRAVLEHLQTLTLRRTLAPTATDQELRHVEGQRHLVAYVSALVARGLRR